jgi:hypothetical protein
MRARVFILLTALLVFTLASVRLHAGDFERPVCHCALCSAADQPAEIPLAATALRFELWSPAAREVGSPVGSVPARACDACRAPPLPGYVS